MKFRVQIRNEKGHLLTEWLLNDGEDGSEVDIVGEVAWLQEATGGVTHADQVAEPTR